MKRDQEDDSLGKVLVAQVWGPEFKDLVSCKNGTYL